MGKKKSLGHNPLANGPRSYANYDFITPSKGKENEKEDNESKVKKETASYYLESPLVSRIKLTANENDLSYSAVVSKILKSHFQRND